jgi:hypothetical protein
MRTLVFGSSLLALSTLIGCQSAQDTSSAAGIHLEQGYQDLAARGKTSVVTEQIVKPGDNQRACEELAAEINGLGQPSPAGLGNADAAGSSTNSYIGLASSLLGSGAGLLGLEEVLAPSVPGERSEAEANL